MARVLRLVLFTVDGRRPCVRGRRMPAAQIGVRRFFGWKPLFGDLATDTTPIIAQVGEIEITAVGPRAVHR